MLPEDQWSDCPRGLVGEMVSRRRQQRRQQLAARVGTATAAVGVLLLGFLVTSQMSETTTTVEKISCVQAASLFAKYHQQQLNAEQAEQVATHLRECPHCSRRYKAEFSTEARRAVPEGQPVAQRFPRSSLSPATTSPVGANLGAEPELALAY